ncbi:SUKH-4 family immunity protein [Streptomyces sp. NBC_00250]|uniref:SUKH-4 family immunity protein n=1 Tax=Streptomyces sp. NBC_00250 TaxID=2903641 RepID=UPI002E2DA948|nr:SUKH-4 family immunity protein [Streptomyces sp. NBC_00250]
MNFAVTMSELINRFGITGINLFPRYDHLPPLHEKTAAFLSAVGLPHSDQFMSRTEGDPINLADRFSEEDGELPKECGTWLEIGWFQNMIIALDPADRKVYAFPEGTPLEDYEQLNRDVESLVHTVVAFEEFSIACQEAEDLDLLENRFKHQINLDDQLPFSDEDSQWSRITDDVLEACWTA